MHINTEKQPKVAVIILNWNGWQDTIECLESLRQIEYPNYQIIVVDNGSTNGSIDKIREWAQQRPTGAASVETVMYRREEAEGGGQSEKEDRLIKASSADRLIFILNESNLGFAAGNNVAIRYAYKRECPCICLLNNDTVVETDFLTQLVETLENNPGWMAVSPKIVYKENPTKIWYAGGLIRLWRANVIHIGSDKTDGTRWRGIHETEHLSGCCFLAKRSLYEITGLLDESYFFGYEDSDFSCVLKEKGIKVGINLNTRIFHKLGGSAGSDNPFYVYHFNKNRLLTLKKHGSFAEQLVGYSFYACTRIIKFASSLFRGNIKAIKAEIRAIHDFLMGS